MQQVDLPSTCYIKCWPTKNAVGWLPLCLLHQVLTYQECSRLTSPLPVTSSYWLTKNAAGWPPLYPVTSSDWPTTSFGTFEMCKNCEVTWKFEFIGTSILLIWVLVDKYVNQTLTCTTLLVMCHTVYNDVYAVSRALPWPSFLLASIRQLRFLCCFYKWYHAHRLSYVWISLVNSDWR